MCALLQETEPLIEKGEKINQNVHIGAIGQVGAQHNESENLSKHEFECIKRRHISFFFPSDFSKGW